MESGVGGGAVRKSILLALAIALLLTGCASQQAGYVGYDEYGGYASGYAGGYYLGDCVYPDLCGSYFYYTPLFPTGPLSPERLRVDLTARHRIPRFVGPRGSSHDPGSGYSSLSSSSGSYTSSSPASAAPSVPLPPPPPPAVQTVGPRS
jgi:hypothetical protein